MLFWLAPDQAALQEVLPLRDLLARHGAPASLLDEVGRLLPPHDRMAVQGRDDLSNLPPR